MQIRLETKKTAGEALAALELCMNLNPRKRNFHAWAEKSGAGLIVSPECELIEARNPENWGGLAMIMRDRWNTVPGYSERVAGVLSGIQKGEN